MTTLTIYQKTKSPLNSFHCSREKYFKIYRKTLKKNDSIHHSQSNFSDFTDQSRQRITFKGFIDPPTYYNIVKYRKTTTYKTKVVDYTITNNFYKIMKIKTIIPKNTKFAIQKNIHNKTTEMDYSFSYKKMKKLIKRPSLEKYFYGPSCCSYDPNPDNFKRKLAKKITFSKSVISNEINYKKYYIPESIKTSKSKFYEKSQNNSTDDSFSHKERPKLKRRAPFTYFPNEYDKENLLQQGNNSDVITHHSYRKRNRGLISRATIKRMTSREYKDDEDNARRQRYTVIPSSFGRREIDKMYENQKRKYKIPYTYSSYLSNISFVDYIESFFNEYGSYSTGDSFIHV